MSYDEIRCFLRRCPDLRIALIAEFLAYTSDSGRAIGSIRSLTTLHEIRVQGFKSIREQTAQFAPLNVIVGANGAGK